MTRPLIQSSSFSATFPGIRRLTISYQPIKQPQHGLVDGIEPVQIS